MPCRCVDEPRGEQTLHLQKQDESCPGRQHVLARVDEIASSGEEKFALTGLLERDEVGVRCDPAQNYRSLDACEDAPTTPPAKASFQPASFPQASGKEERITLAMFWPHPVHLLPTEIG